MPDKDTNFFFDHPILNSPYTRPQRHWELDTDGQPTQRIIERRRVASFVTPIPKPRKHKASKQGELAFTDDEKLAQAISNKEQSYHTGLIEEIRHEVEAWRQAPQADWKVTPVTARLLQHWRHHEFSGIRPFFCQVEAAETAIWLTEVAPKSTRHHKYLDHLADCQREANPELSRLALKLATGAGKTTVMAMLIAWQTLNAVRSPLKKGFTKGFLIVAPGITIKDRLRVLLPNDPESYYSHRELVPADMLQDMQQARIVITNYHAFKLREKLKLAKGTQSALTGWRNEAMQTEETDGEMLQRVMPGLMNLKNIMVINDEAHHCYREKTDPDADQTREDELAGLKGDDRKAAKDEAESNREAARLWISGLEKVQAQLGISRVLDLSATPFFLKGSGYREGTLFPWTLSDFSLMDAIECGIVKLPRVPVSQDIPGGDMPMYRNLWETIRDKMPKKGKGDYDPAALPPQLCTALQALYSHYATVFDDWEKAGVRVPPCFIIVCNNTSTSKAVFKYISGYMKTGNDGSQYLQKAALPLFSNYGPDGAPLARPNTILVDSVQLEADDTLDAAFAEAAKDEIERFMYEMKQRGDPLVQNVGKDGTLPDAVILREVLNTVGKAGRLGGGIRCVVSVSMLTEGWDANNVTHVLGVRAFGTQLLCEQIVGRALRRLSYELNEEGLFSTEYSDVLGVPFDFTAKPVPIKPVPVVESVHVCAVRPDRDQFEIRFPRVAGYREELPEDRLFAKFDEDSRLVLSPKMVGAVSTQMSGIVGKEADITPAMLDTIRTNTVLMHLTKHLLERYHDGDGNLKLHLFGQLKAIVTQWFHEWFVCEGNTRPAQLLLQPVAERACDRIAKSIRFATLEQPRALTALLDPFNKEGSTRHVSFFTTKKLRWQTKDKCHINWCVLDSDWEAELCRVVEKHPRVLRYAKNQGLGFEVPYTLGGEQHRYVPDFIVDVDDGHGAADPLHLVVEIKGFRGEDAIEKKNTMETRWIPGVNSLGAYGRWAFREYTAFFDIEKQFKSFIATLGD